MNISATRLCVATFLVIVYGPHFPTYAIIPGEPAIEALDNEVSIDEASITLGAAASLIAEQAELEIGLRFDPMSLARLKIDSEKKHAFKVEKTQAWIAICRLICLASPDTQLTLVIRVESGRKAFVIEEFRGQENVVFVDQDTIKTFGLTTSANH